MGKSVTRLMKELKGIEYKIKEIHTDDEKNSTVPVDNNFQPKYDVEYSYYKNREKVRELQKREARIHQLLNSFNNSTKVIGYDITIAEALVRISQLRNEIKTLTVLAARQKYVTEFYVEREVKKICYDIETVKDDLEMMHVELCDLQVAVDKTNLNSTIDED